MSRVIPFARAAAASQRKWWMCINIPLIKKAKVRGRQRFISIWIGPFAEEKQQVSWRSGFDAALEKNELKNYEIKVVPTGRNYPKVSSADIPPETDPEIAVQMLPQLVLEKMNEAASK